PPFSQAELQKAGEEAMKRLIRENDPAKPSTKLSSSHALPTVAANRHMDPARLTRQVRGDLDSIVMKALEKEPARSYATARGFAEDVGRFLGGEPVQARPPTNFDRAMKWMRRRPNIAAIYGLTLLAVVLVGIGGTMAGLWREAKSAKSQAINDRNIAQ